MGCFQQTQVISHLELKTHAFVISLHFGILQGRPEYVLHFNRPMNFKNCRTFSEGQDKARVANKADRFATEAYLHEKTVFL